MNTTDRGATPPTQTYTSSTTGRQVTIPDNDAELIDAVVSATSGIVHLMDPDFLIDACGTATGAFTVVSASPARVTCHLCLQAAGIDTDAVPA